MTSTTWFLLRGERVMFGSQMVWPQAINSAIDNIEAAPFLSKKQKRDILYNNAARFLRLRAPKRLEASPHVPDHNHASVIGRK
jgi:hypothetical protein